MNKYFETDHNKTLCNPFLSYDRSKNFYACILFSNKVCRNINRIKICMEAGKKVVLLNLQNLYESLYDALNQVRPEDYFGKQMNSPNIM